MGMKAVRQARGVSLVQDGPAAKSIRPIVGGAHGAYTETLSPKDTSMVPKKPAARVFHDFPVTPEPMSNEWPTRGEGPQRNVKVKKNGNGKER